MIVIVTVMEMVDEHADRPISKVVDEVHRHEEKAEAWSEDSENNDGS